MAGFELIPAIDLLGGSTVRLAQGDYDQATVTMRIRRTWPNASSPLESSGST